VVGERDEGDARELCASDGRPVPTAREIAWSRP
jgi:hypothetical protein